MTHAGYGSERWILRPTRARLRLPHVQSARRGGFDLDMTLIDTAPGLPATAGAPSAPSSGVDFPVEEMTAKLGPPLDLLLEPYLAGRRDRARPATGSARSTPTTRSRRRPRSPAPTRPSPPYAATAAGILVVTGKYPANAQLHLDHLAFDVDHLEGWVWGVGKADVLRREGATIYVGDHVHDVEGALAAGALSVSVLTGGCTREELVAAGTHVVLDDLADFPAWLDEHLLAAAARRARGRPARARRRCWSPTAAAPTAPSCWPPRSARSGRSTSPPRPATPTRCPLAERDPARAFAESPRRRGAHPRDPRDGARGLPRQRRRPLLLLQGRAARRARPARRRARARPRRDRHQRRRRGRRLPPGHPGRGRARRDHPAARRRAHQGPGPRGLAPLGPADLGQARRRLPVLADRLRRRGHARTGWPASSAPRPPSRDLLGRRPRWSTCGSATSATGPRSSSTPPCCRSPAETERALVDAVRAAGFEAADDRPARIPLGIDERALLIQDYRQPFARRPRP